MKTCALSSLYPLVCSIAAAASDGVVELDEGESLRDAVGAFGHVETVLADDADLTVDLSDDGAELLELGVRDLREVVDDDHGAEARLGLDLLDVDALVVADDAHVIARGHLQVLDVHLGPVDVAILRRVGKRAANVSADGGNEGGKAQGLRRDGAEIAVFTLGLLPRAATGGVRGHREGFRAPRRGAGWGGISSRPMVGVYSGER